jgi:hypothetical protein
MLEFTVIEIHSHGDDHVITEMAHCKRYGDAMAVLNCQRSAVIVRAGLIILERAINPAQYTKLKEYIENATQ